MADRKSSDHKKLYYWLTVYVRYYLAYTMLDYGFAKVFIVQFTPLFPNLNQLVQPYGDFTPQGLLWKFMGYLKSYQTFTGFCEVIGGLLLLFRRTYDIKTDTVKKTVIISSGTDSLANFNFDQPANNILTFTGHWNKDSLFIKMKKVDINNFRLVQWKSRWVYPGGESNY